MKQDKKDITYVNFHQEITEVLLPEAYPYIEDLNKFVQAYMDSDSSILILYGPPGTGKTKLTRFVIKKIVEKTKRNEVFYTQDSTILDDEDIFISFMQSKFSDVFVLEDLDQKLKSRSEDNTVMNKLLFVSDGLIVSSRNKKILITTNMESVTKNQKNIAFGMKDVKETINEALTRPGRCFKAVHCRMLTEVEAIALATKLGKDPSLIPTDTKSFSVADIYNLK